MNFTTVLINVSFVNVSGDSVFKKLCKRFSAANWTTLDIASRNMRVKALFCVIYSEYWLRKITTFSELKEPAQWPVPWMSFSFFTTPPISWIVLTNTL